MNNAATAQTVACTHCVSPCHGYRQSATAPQLPRPANLLQLSALLFGIPWAVLAGAAWLSHQAGWGLGVTGMVVLGSLTTCVLLLRLNGLKLERLLRYPPTRGRSTHRSKPVSSSQFSSSR